MAIISIPTSIGGINIPSSAAGGPLGSLYTVDGLDYIKYPRDLESSTRSHVVLFKISERKEIDFQQLGSSIGSSISSLVNQASDFKLPSLQDVQTSVSNATSTVTQMTGEQMAVAAGDMAKSSITAVGQYGNQFRQFVSNVEATPKAYIALYMPETMQFNYSPQYDDGVTLASAAGAIPKIGNIVSMVTSGLQNDAVRLALNKAGYVFNPNQQLLFQGISFREFQLSFTFTPYSRQEQEAVTKIIKLFRSYSAPTIVDAAAGMFFKAPGVFDIQFLFNGAQNKNVPKFKTSVIKNVDVNYAPNGWSAHDDGSPVQTTVTIDFQEMYLVDSKDISKDGY